MSIKNIEKYLNEIRKDIEFISPGVLEPIPYKNQNQPVWVEIYNPEFTSLCPKTGLPDYGTIHVKYIPDQYIVELKSLKYYFLQYRNTGIFYEHLTPLILNHLKETLHPIKMVVEAEFTARGGISTKVTSSYDKEEC